MIREFSLKAEQQTPVHRVNSSLMKGIQLKRCLYLERHSEVHSWLFRQH